MGEAGTRRRRKLTVEECMILDSQYLAKKALLAGFPIENFQGNPSIEIGIRHSVSKMEGPKTIDMQISLNATRTSFGALRWWFICPILKNGNSCKRRVGKLYLPPGASSFGCRHCHDLTYRSVREHDRRVDFYKRNSDALVAVLENPAVKLRQVILALKAVSWSE
jgi:hypothetical protein